jgi:hypothetical protein
LIGNGNDSATEETNASEWQIKRINKLC